MANGSRSILETAHPRCYKTFGNVFYKGMHVVETILNDAPRIWLEDSTN